MLLDPGHVRGEGGNAQVVDADGGRADQDDLVLEGARRQGPVQDVRDGVHREGLVRPPVIDQHPGVLVGRDDGRTQARPRPGNRAPGPLSSAPGRARPPAALWAHRNRPDNRWRAPPSGAFRPQSGIMLIWARLFATDENRSSVGRTIFAAKGSKGFVRCSSSRHSGSGMKSCFLDVKPDSL